VWRDTRDHNLSSESSSWLDFVQSLFFGAHAWYIIGFFLFLSVFCLRSASLIYTFYVTSRTLRKIRTSWSESTVIHIKVINHPDRMDLLCVSLRMRQMKDCSLERAHRVTERKKTQDPWVMSAEWVICSPVKASADVKWAGLKQDKCHLKLKTLLTNQIQSTSSWDTQQVHTIAQNRKKKTQKGG